MTLVFTVGLSAISVIIGVSLANALRPGERISAEQRAALSAQYEEQAGRELAQARQAKPLRDALLDLIPRNLLREMVGAVDGSSPGGGMLAVMFFALIFGIALTLTPERTKPLIAVLEGIYDVVMVIVGLAMRLAPLAVAGLVFALSARLGADILKMLAWYMATVLAGLALHFFGVYSLMWLCSAHQPIAVYGRVSDAILTAFGHHRRMPRCRFAARHGEKPGRAARNRKFLLTVGSTANQNGTAFTNGVTVLFWRKVFGVDLPWPTRSRSRSCACSRAS